MASARSARPAPSPTPRARVLAPGVIRAENPSNRLIVGRPDDRPDARLDALASLLTPSGLEVTVTPKSETPSGPSS